MSTPEATHLDKPNVNAIQFLVARAVKGVNKSNVAVMDNQGNLLSDESENRTE